MAYTYVLRNTPALACSSNSAALLSCHLMIKYSAILKQAAIVISLSTHTHAFDDAQLFVLSYNADNLVADGTFLGPGPKDLPPSQLAEIARRTTLIARTLHLTLHAPCPVRCPPSTGCIAPKPGHETRFRQLRDLASSTEVRITFDSNWVHEQQHAVLYRLINHPDKFAGIPVEKYQGPSSRQADWTVFGPDEAAHSDAPPSYDDVPAKRQRSPTANSSPQQPPAKRERARSPVPDLKHPSTELATPSSPGLGSPTEKATTIAEGSFSPCPPLSPYINTPDPQDATKATLEALLPDALHKMMPDLLARAFAVPRPPTSDPLAAGSIGSLISARVAADVESHLRPLHTKAIEEGCTEAVKQMSGGLITRICSNTLKEVHRTTLDNAFDQRVDADYQFFAELEEHKLDMTLAKDEGLEEIRREFDSKLQELVATAAETVVRSGAELQEQADDMRIEAWKLLRRALRIEEASSLQHIRETVEREQAALEEEGRRRARSPARHPPAGWGQRATSLPL